MLLAGLAIWTALQGYLTSVPVWTRSLPPEVDDSLAYLVRTLEIKECFFQDCPALQDLRRQIDTHLPDPDSAQQRDVAGFPFPFYHPGFSVILLGIARLGVDLTTAYKILWSFSPLLFGVAFACIVAAIWGRAAAGVALVLLAFKVFPDTGLHYLTPSNFAMAIAVLVWARIIQRNGDAPWTLVFGSLVLFTIHPVGGLYALFSALLALAMPRPERKWRARLAVLAIFLLCCISAVVVSQVKKPSLVNVLAELCASRSFADVAGGYLSNLVGVLVRVVNLKAALFGPFALFLFAVTLGLLVSSKHSRAVVARFFGLSALFLAGSLLFTSRFSPPGDVFFRMWIPTVVVSFGAVGHAIRHVFEQGRLRLREELKNTGDSGGGLNIGRLWPVLILAVLLGYSADTIFHGAEQVQATVQYMENRQPLKFDTRQADMLLSLAKPGDRVLYTATMPMSFYFLHGAMSLGAVYYHPAFRETVLERDWLRRPDVRFAVAYNPTVYHPALEGLDEKDQCISQPEYGYSPLGNRRKYGPINREGTIAASDFRWIEIEPRTSEIPASVGILVRNPGNSSIMELVSIGPSGEPVPGFKATGQIPAGWTGRVRFDIEWPIRGRLRLQLPNRNNGFLISGIVFGESTLNWPWEQKALVTLSARDPSTGLVRVSFDPADILPADFGGHIQVLDDGGSSVLLRIDRD